ncbi:MAG: class I SAM-dependent methyltransferase [Chitinophagia bacterium]|nr:class I SAM-dependent methyltransferase [Chitinophagia bacterium]
MYNQWQIAIRYLKYWITASNGRGHGIHSPFVFEWITRVLQDDRKFYAYASIEQQRELLLHNNQLLEVKDLGAGSRSGSLLQRKVSSVAAQSLKPPKYAQLLFRMVHFYECRQVLELGTCLGITTSYLSTASDQVKVITLEGVEAYAKTANSVFTALDLNQIQLVLGNFDDTLSEVLKKNPSFDFVFIDGNHRQEPTLRYFEQILPNLHANSMVVLDDIHWSSEMEMAWNTIREHPSVTLTLDLFFIGIVFLRKEQQQKEHFVIRY